VEANVIGNMQMIDSGQEDDKIIAVAAQDPSVNHFRRIEELPQHFLLELKNFFEQYKVLENKKVEIDTFPGPGHRLPDHQGFDRICTTRNYQH
jgi:inorganic pyrophosphatase